MLLRPEREDCTARTARARCGALRHRAATSSLPVEPEHRAGRALALDDGFSGVELPGTSPVPASQQELHQHAKQVEEPNATRGASRLPLGPRGLAESSVSDVVFDCPESRMPDFFRAERRKAESSLRSTRRGGIRPSDFWRHHDDFGCDRRCRFPRFSSL